MFTAFASEFGLSDEFALKIASMFGGGIGRQGYVCGAAVGGLMVLGLRYGFTQPQHKGHTYAIASEFIRRFQEQNKAVNCRDLLGVDLSDPAAARQAREDGTFVRVCPRIIQNAIEIVDDMLKQKTITNGK